MVKHYVEQVREHTTREARDALQLPLDTDAPRPAADISGQYDADLVHLQYVASCGG